MPVPTQHDDDLSSQRDALPASEGWYDDLSSWRDALPASKGRYAMPATTGRDDRSIIKSPQQIDSIMKLQYGKKIGKLPDSFATVLELE
jgi:hypothetical protein